MAKDEASPARKQIPTCCGVIEEVTVRSRERRDKRRKKPMPWVLLKSAIAITVGVTAYAFWVYIGKFCVPMIKHNQGALGGRAMGIGFLVVFCFLGLMMIWSYIKIICTSPGLAKHHVQKSPRPVAKSQATPTWWEESRDISGTPYEFVPQEHAPPMSVLPPPPQRGRMPKGSGSAFDEDREANAGMTDALPPVAEARAVRANGSATHTDMTHRTDSSKLPMMYTRKPLNTGEMLPENRYCRREEFVKPPRAHHCRACGTCVLRYDHHCPWIGQCVGARNHRFFIIFLEWAFLFCAWTLSTMVAEVARMGKNSDGQEVSVVILAGLFLLFTSALLISHVHMIVHNQTTVEALDDRAMKDREKAVLARMFAWYEFGARARTKRQWNEEWGRISREGNLWWLGSYRKNWESVMGSHVWQWFVPIGRSPTDGLSFPTNPRFDAEGRWRPRREWPRELQ